MFSARLNEVQAAKILGLSVHTLRADRYRVVNRGRTLKNGILLEPKLGIPFKKIGKRVLYDLDELTLWQSENEIAHFPDD